MEDIIISNKKELKDKIKRISEAGKSELHVISDFDRTLTKALVNGKEVLSVISVLRDGDYLTSEYRKKAHELADKYKPIESNPKLSIEEKKPIMQEWWREHFNLLINSKLNKKDIEEVVNSREFEFRKGTVEFIASLNKNNIPLIIISASGLGDTIPIYLEKNKILYGNVHIITNGFIFDSKGHAISVKEPIITSMNKDESALRKYPIFKTIEERKNVLLLGNSIADIKMIHGFNYSDLIKIGFLNENIERDLEKFKKAYDVVILNDGNMDYVNELLIRIIKK